MAYKRYPRKIDEHLTIEQLVNTLPKKLKSQATPAMVDQINGLLVDPQLRENFRDNLLSFSSVLQDSRYRIHEYINAVRFVSHRLLGSNVSEAYAKTFPERYQRLISEGADSRYIGSFAGAYSKTKLVIQLFEQSMMPVHILNMDLFQEALNTQAVLMRTSNSDTVKTKAADSILLHTKAPEAAKVEVDVTYKQDSSIDELRATTKALLEQQKSMLFSNGMSVKELAHSKIIPGEVIQNVKEEE